VYGFQDREQGSYDTYVPMGSHVTGDRVWDVAMDNGRDASVFNVPVTFPPARIQRQVSGFLSPSVEEASSSSDVRQTIERFDYQVDVNAKLGHNEDKIEFIEDAHDTLTARHKTFRHYLQRDDWDLFSVCS